MSFNHLKRHRELHRHLDELVADMIRHTKMLPSEATIMDLMKWSNTQIIRPTEDGGDEDRQGQTHDD